MSQPTQLEQAWIDKLNAIFPVGTRWHFGNAPAIVHVVTNGGAYCQDGKFFIDTLNERFSARPSLGLSPHMLTPVPEVPEVSEAEQEIARLREENDRLRLRCKALAQMNDEKSNRIAKLRKCLG